jgi:hypothetical protein
LMKSGSRSTTATGGDHAAEAELQFAQVARVLASMRQGEVPPTVRPGTRQRARLDAGTPIQHSVASAYPRSLRRKHVARSTQAARSVRSPA